MFFDIVVFNANWLLSCYMLIPKKRLLCEINCSHLFTYYLYDHQMFIHQACLKSH